MITQVIFPILGSSGVDTVLLQVHLSGHKTNAVSCPNWHEGWGEIVGWKTVGQGMGRPTGVGVGR